MIWPFRKTLAAPTRLVLDDPALFEDPYPVFDALRVHGPLADIHPGGHLLIGHEAVTEALRNPALGNAPSRFSALHARFRDTRVAADLANNILPFLDAPEHGPARRSLVQAFGPCLKAILPQLSDLAEAKVRQAAPGRTELIASLSSPSRRR